MTKKLKILVIFDTAEPEPIDKDYTEEFKTTDWQAERDVVVTLKELGHEVHLLGIYDDVDPIFHTVKEVNPDVIFNLTEQFMKQPQFDKHIVSLFELLKQAYTGSPPGALMLSKNKGIAKKVLTHHRIKTPAFKVFNCGEKIKPSKDLSYPILVKPLREEASYGISQNSLVVNHEELVRRIEYVHQSMNQDVIIEEYVEGRELYVSILGNRKLRVFPIREMVFSNELEPEQKFATYKAKWDLQYRKRWGIQNQFARNLSDDLIRRIENVTKKVYRLLYLKGYARLDLRLTKNNEISIIEANPNPHIGKGEDFASSAKKAGIVYPDLIQRIINLGLEEYKRFFGRM